MADGRAARNLRLGLLRLSPIGPPLADLLELGIQQPQLP